MSVEAEFIVNLGPYEHVKVTLSGDDLTDAMKGGLDSVGEALGDMHASLKAAVLYGRDKALLDARLEAGIEQAKAGETKDLGDFSHHLEGGPEEAQPLFKQVEGEDLPNGNVAFKVHQGEPLTPLVDVPEEGQGVASSSEEATTKPAEQALEDPVKLLTEELGAIVLEVTEKPQEGPSSPSGLRANGSEPDAPARPWKNKPAAKKTKAWEDPVTEGPDATPEESVTATKAARKAATASDWDW